MFIYVDENLDLNLINYLNETFCSIQLREILWYIIFEKRIKKSNELYSILYCEKFLDAKGKFILNTDILRDNILFVINNKQQIYKNYETFNFKNFNKKTIMFLRFIDITLLYNIINEINNEHRKVLLSNIFKRTTITDEKYNIYLDNIIIFLMMM